MTKPLPRTVIEGKNGRVEIRATAKGSYRIKATMFDGDEIAEARLVASAADLLREVIRAETGRPDLMVKLGPIRHKNDHKPLPPETVSG